MKKDREAAEPHYLVIGQVRGAWGMRGQVKVEVMTDFPNRFADLTRVYIGTPPEPVQIEHWRPHNRHVVLKLAGYDDRTAAETLQGQLLQIPTEEAMPLGEDEYYVHQIEGLEVLTTGGEYLGKVTEVLFTGSNDVYVVTNEAGREALIPAIADVVQEIDLDAGRLVVELIPGLLE